MAEVRSGVWAGMMTGVVFVSGSVLAWIFLGTVVEVHSGVWARVLDGVVVFSEMLVVV